MRLETEDDIQRLIDDRIPENYILEYKKEPWPEKKGKNTATEIAKDISAFANTQGGQIILGVEEDKKTKEPIARHPFEISNWEERIEDIRHNAIKPYIEGLRIYRIKSDEQKGKAYLIVEIPESPNTPHMVTTSNKYYRRDNSGAKPMSETEVEELYSRRISQEQKLEELYSPLFHIFDIMKAQVEENRTRWFCFLLPLTFNNKRVQLHNKEFNNALGNTVRKSNFSHFINPDNQQQLAGCIGFTDSRGVNYGFEEKDSYLWIHENGGVLAVSRIYPFHNNKEETWEIPVSTFISFFEKTFRFVELFFGKAHSMLPLQSIIHLINAGKWWLGDFLDSYPDNLRISRFPDYNIPAKPREMTPILSR